MAKYGRFWVMFVHDFQWPRKMRSHKRQTKSTEEHLYFRSFLERCMSLSARTRLFWPLQWSFWFDTALPILVQIPFTLQSNASRTSLSEVVASSCLFQSSWSVYTGLPFQDQYDKIGIVHAVTYSRASQSIAVHALLLWSPLLLLSFPPRVLVHMCKSRRRQQQHVNGFQ